ncbi:unnamed protein product [Clonostachys byssicola]|uniref:Uncharacterized protein n=1 Tax=Clonostachys byssicola TaxID=160290 RepID=A0A9N9UIK0_9HYPO|nr:unnamed protein product [Clonostachys byssicola]
MPSLTALNNPETLASSIIVKKIESQKKKNNNGNKRPSHDQAEGKVSEAAPAKVERREGPFCWGRFEGIS